MMYRIGCSFGAICFAFFDFLGVRTPETQEIANKSIVAMHSTIYKRERINGLIKNITNIANIRII
jgi:hypothetical protein